jgi:hypothetical protein
MYHGSEVRPTNHANEAVTVWLSRLLGCKFNPANIRLCQAWAQHNHLNQAPQGTLYVNATVCSRLRACIRARCTLSQVELRAYDHGRPLFAAQGHSAEFAGDRPAFTVSAAPCTDSLAILEPWSACKCLCARPHDHASFGTTPNVWADAPRVTILVGHLRCERTESASADLTPTSVASCGSSPYWL